MSQDRDDVQGVLIRQSGPLAIETVTTALVTGSWTDRSGTIAVGGTSQQLLAANVSRKGWFVQNVGSDALWINFGVAAVIGYPSVRIPIGASYEEVPPGLISTQQVNIISATTGMAFTAKEF